MFEEKVEEHREMIDREIKFFFSRYCTSDNPSLKALYTLAEEQMQNGKRLRPILLIESYKICTGMKHNGLIPASISVELLHNYTLIHDDIMDEDTKRRGKENTLGKLIRMYESSESMPSTLFTNKKINYGVSLGIILGNILRAAGVTALEYALDIVTFEEAVKIYNKADIIVNEGQCLDIIYEKQMPSLDEYLTMIQKKTANLFYASAGIGAALASQKTSILGSTINAVQQYAMKVGMAFQIQDDILDIQLGKGNTFGADIRRGKNTILLIKSRELANEKQRQTLDAVVKKADATDEEIRSVIQVMHDTGAIEYAKKYAFDMVDSAKIILQQAYEEAKKQHFPFGNTEFLNNYADYTVSRLK
jgi:geranylgeranyl diphosphate synthase type I